MFVHSWLFASWNVSVKCWTSQHWESISSCTSWVSIIIGQLRFKCYVYIIFISFIVISLSNTETRSDLSVLNSILTNVETLRQIIHRWNCWKWRRTTVHRAPMEVQVQRDHWNVCRRDLSLVFCDNNSCEQQTTHSTGIFFDRMSVIYSHAHAHSHAQFTGFFLSTSIQRRRRHWVTRLNTRFLSFRTHRRFFWTSNEPSEIWAHARIHR